MRIVLDTNIVISGIFWKGAPRQILDLARSGKVTLFTSPDMLAELANVLERKKFLTRLAHAKTNPTELVLGYAALAKTVRPKKINAVIKADPDDDKVLACAKTAKAQAIVSGDTHLLKLRQYIGIEILTINEILEKLVQ